VTQGPRIVSLDFISGLLTAVVLGSKSPTLDYGYEDNQRSSLSANFYYFFFQLCSSLLGGVESLQIAVL
jgi:hypothetical protein